MYTLLRELVCNIASYCMNGHGIFDKPKASENVVHECNTHDMQANKCNKIIIHYQQQRRVSSHTKY